MQTLTDHLFAVPPWAVALFIVVAGWLTARLAQLLTARALQFFHFNAFCDRTGITEALRKGDVTRSPCELAGRGVHWLIVVGSLLEAARYLDIGMAVALRQRVIAAIPSLLSAALVLAVGLILVTFVAGTVRTLSRNAGSPYANMWARITRWTGTVLVLALAGEQADIHGSVFIGVLYIFIAALALGLALAFGLGCKDMARGAMEQWIANLKENHRDTPKSDLEG